MLATVVLFYVSYSLLAKREVADRLLDRIALALDARDADAQTSMS